VPKSPMKFHRTRDPFARVPRDTLQDEGLSLKAKGIIALLASLPPDWTVYQSHLVKVSTDGRDALRSGLEELEEAGYLYRHRIRNDDGTLGPHEVHVFDRPVDDPEAEIARRQEAKSGGIDQIGKSDLDQIGKSDLELNKREYQEHELAHTREDPPDDPPADDRAPDSPDWLKPHDPQPLGPDDQQIDPSMLASEWSRLTEGRLRYDTNRERLTEARAICAYFDAETIRWAIKESRHVDRPHRWKYFRLHLNLEAVGDYPIPPEKFRKVYYEAVGKSFPPSQTKRLLTILAGHTQSQIEYALAKTHTADRPCFRYFKKVLESDDNR